jgi:uncharacterized membrane protein
MQPLSFYRSVHTWAVQLGKMDAHHRVLCAFAVAFVTGISFRGHLLWTSSLAAYDAFAFVSLALIWIAIALTPGEEIPSIAQKQDVGRTIIFVFVIAAGCAALLAVAFLIRSGKGQPHLTLHLLLAAMTVVLSWLLMHSVFGLRYAHNFYGDSDMPGQKRGGLIFPGKELPDYGDFAYFSFVIGMTCQVSDVQVSSGEMRRLVLQHGVLSFAFNTVILALTINIISGLL